MPKYLRKGAFKRISFWGSHKKYVSICIGLLSINWLERAAVSSRKRDFIILCPLTALLSRDQFLLEMPFQERRSADEVCREPGAGNGAEHERF